MTKELFYGRCSEILGVDHCFKDIQYTQRRTNRWGPREPGNGRYRDIGLIRWFSPAFIQVNLNDPRVSKNFKSEQSVFEFLEGVMNERSTRAKEIHCEMQGTS